MIAGRKTRELKGAAATAYGKGFRKKGARDSLRGVAVSSLPPRYSGPEKKRRR